MWLVCTHGPMNSCGVDRPSYFFKFTLYNADAHNTHAHSPL
jgi:hypothetical protein